jgi:hypothetical protein
MPRTFLRALFCAATCLIVLSEPVFAVVTVSGDDVSVAPSDGSIPGFYNVCYTGVPGDTSSGVYLGNNWVLSAWHTVAGLPNNEPASVSFTDAAGNYTTIPVDPTTPSVQLTNPSDNSPTDLVLYRLSSAPQGLPTLQISPNRAAVNDHAFLVADGGMSAGPQLHYYHVDSSSNWSDSTTAPAGPLGPNDFAGLPTLAGSGPHWAHWGDNVVSDASSMVYDGYGHGPCITTKFDNLQYTSTQPKSHEAQAFFGDSGGAVFINGRLSGVIVSVTLAGGQSAPGNPALFGSQSYALDLSSYRQQIVSVTGTGSGASRLGDFNGDGNVNAADIDILAANLRNNTTTPDEDVNGDSVVNNCDLNYLVGRLVDINGGGELGAHGTHYGDANLDGKVNSMDLGIYLQHSGQPGAMATWANANFPDGSNNTVVGGEDLLDVIQNFGDTGPNLAANGAADAIINSVTIVPEPATLTLAACGILIFAAARRRRIRQAIFHAGADCN